MKAMPLILAILSAGIIGATAALLFAPSAPGVSSTDSPSEIARLSAEVRALVQRVDRMEESVRRPPP